MDWKTTLPPFNPAFLSHSRRWRDLLYVYPVVSRRSHGLSIGVNLNPDGACNFDCVYCSVDRKVEPRVRTVDLGALDAELRRIVETRDQLFQEPEFRDTTPDYRRLNDIAFSGNGEPTASRVFPAPLVRNTPVFSTASRIRGARQFEDKTPTVINIAWS